MLTHMTHRNFVSWLHERGISATTFFEALTHWERVAMKEGAPNMKILGIEFIPDMEKGSAEISMDDTSYEYTNIAIAWMAFIEMVDAAGRRWIGEQLEQHGYDPCYGTKEESTVLPEGERHAVL